MYDYRIAAGGEVDGALINAGGIRASIASGDVTQGDVLTSFPFLNAVTDLKFTGAELWDVFEGIVSDYSNATKHEVTSLVQVSRTMKFSWNPANPVGTIVTSRGRCGSPACAAPSSSAGMTVSRRYSGGVSQVMATSAERPAARAIPGRSTPAPISTWRPSIGGKT